MSTLKQKLLASVSAFTVALGIGAAAGAFSGPDDSGLRDPIDDTELTVPSTDVTTPSTLDDDFDDEMTTPTIDDDADELEDEDELDDHGENRGPGGGDDHEDRSGSNSGPG